MPHDSHDMPTIRQLIDACPADETALQLAEFESLAQAVQNDAEVAKQVAAAKQFDLQLSAALAKVEVPPDAQARMTERLLAELSAAKVTLSAEPIAATGEVNSSRTSRRNQVRSLTRWAVAACLLVSAAVAVWAWRPQPRVDVISLAEHWQENLTEQWQPLPPNPKGYPLPTDLAFRPRSWQRLPNHGGYRGVAYDFSRPEARAVLFMVRVLPDQQLPNRPPQSPQYSAGGRMMAAWIADRWLCLLVMDGNQRAYETLVQGRAAPLAVRFISPGMLATAATR